MATSQGTSQMLPSGTKMALPTRSAYALIRPRSTSFTCLRTSRSMPLSSTT
jgi:hypothetical protein